MSVSELQRAKDRVRSLQVAIINKERLMASLQARVASGVMKSESLELAQRSLAINKENLIEAQVEVERLTPRCCFMCHKALTPEELEAWALSGLPVSFLPCSKHTAEARKACTERARAERNAS